LETVKQLPLTTPPEVFGLHENADITKAQRETSEMFDTLLLTEAKSVDSSGDEKEIKRKFLIEKCSEILTHLPPRYDLELVQAKYPFSLTDSMPTVLQQECIRYNRLLDTIKRSTEALKRGLTGALVMNHELETLSHAIYNGQIPSLWLNVSYPSRASLSAYLADLSTRMTYLGNWLDNKAPVIINISMLFHPQGFLTGVIQQYARKQQKSQMAIDDMVFDFEFLDRDLNEEKMSKPSDGVYVRGLVIEVCVLF
jgi:dynein heavy chain